MREELRRTVRTVLFDAGGVLLDLDYAYLRRLLETKGFAVSEGELSRAEAAARTGIEKRILTGSRHSQETWRDYFRILLGKVKFDPQYFSGVIDTLWEAHQRVGLWTVPIAGALDVVRDLHEQGYLLGVVSNAEGRVARDLATAGYRACFQTVVDSHLEGVEKPDPQIFERALSRMESDPATSIFIGDVPSIDVAGARAAGIGPILLDRHDLYPNHDVTRLHSLKELPGLLRRLSDGR